MSPQTFPLLQKRQATLLEACGFPCGPAGEGEFGGVKVPMYRPTGEKRGAVADVIGYGGAAYGGKSFGMLALARVAAELWPGVQITYFRRTYTELDGPGASIQKAYELFNGVAQASDGGKEWTWPNGSVLYFRHCQNEKDVYSYQSQQIDILMLDEGTSFTWLIVDYLLTRNRVSGEIGTGFKPFAVIPSNPGNVGHVWYAQIFDVEKKQGEHEQVKAVMNPNGKTSRTYFIPALLEDNQIGVARDPGYEERLMQRDPEIAKALRWGDWTIFAGQMFPQWRREKIACTPFEIPTTWPKWRALDYGFTHPFSAGWFTVNPQTERVYVYRAFKQSGLSDEAQANMLRDLTPPTEQVNITYASPDMWARKSAELRVFTAVDVFTKKGVHLAKADNDRARGVQKIQNLLMPKLDGLPGLQVFENFYDVFNCMTTLVRDARNVNDVLKVDGDDAFDMLKYGLTNVSVMKEKTEQKQDYQRFSL